MGPITARCEWAVMMAEQRTARFKSPNVEDCVEGSVYSVCIQCVFIPKVQNSLSVK